MTSDLLKQDFTQGLMRHLTRTEAKVLADRVVDLISDLIKEAMEQRIDEHCRRYNFIHPK